MPNSLYCQLLKYDVIPLKASFLGFLKTSDSKGDTKCTHVGCGFDKSKQRPKNINCFFLQSDSASFSPNIHNINIHKKAGCEPNWCSITAENIGWTKRRPTTPRKDTRPLCKMRRRILYSETELASPDVVKFEVGIELILAIDGWANYGFDITRATAIYDLGNNQWDKSWWQQTTANNNILIPNPNIASCDISSIKLIDEVLAKLREQI